MSKITEGQLQAFNDELEKLGSKWYSAPAKKVTDFGKRQLHSLTGWTPRGHMDLAGIEEIGAGAAGARKALKGTQGKDRVLAQQSLRAEINAQKMGLTSLPGYARSLMKDPKKTLQAGWAQQWHGSSPVMKAVTVGLPAAATASDLISEDDGHKAERIGAGIANTAVGMVTGGLPMAGGIVAGLGASTLGGQAGRLVDKMRAHKKTPPRLGTLAEKVNPEEARGSHVPLEREVTPAAAGHVPEVMA